MSPPKPKSSPFAATNGSGPSTSSSSGGSGGGGGGGSVTENADARSTRASTRAITLATNRAQVDKLLHRHLNSTERNNTNGMSPKSKRMSFIHAKYRMSKEELDRIKQSTNGDFLEEEAIAVALMISRREAAKRRKANTLARQPRLKRNVRPTRQVPTRMSVCNRLPKRKLYQNNNSNKDRNNNPRGGGGGGGSSSSKRSNADKMKKAKKDNKSGSKKSDKQNDDDDDDEKKRLISIREKKEVRAIIRSTTDSVIPTVTIDGSRLNANHVRHLCREYKRLFGDAADPAFDLATHDIEEIVDMLLHQSSANSCASNDEPIIKPVTLRMTDYACPVHHTEDAIMSAAQFRQLMLVKSLGLAQLLEECTITVSFPNKDKRDQFHNVMRQRCVLNGKPPKIVSSKQLNELTAQAKIEAVKAEKEDHVSVDKKDSEEERFKLRESLPIPSDVCICSPVIADIFRYTKAYRAMQTFMQAEEQKFHELKRKYTSSNGSTATGALMSNGHGETTKKRMKTNNNGSNGNGNGNGNSYKRSTTNNGTNKSINGASTTVVRHSRK